MTTITIQRRQGILRRRDVGSWISNDVVETRVFEVDEECLRPEDLGQGHISHFSLGHGLTATWPDGTVEHAYPSASGPDCYPRCGRLNSLLRGLA